jgi:hypothetical protein
VNPHDPSDVEVAILIHAVASISLPRFLKPCVS